MYNKIKAITKMKSDNEIFRNSLELPLVNYA